jgi:hypothetical protein
MSHAVLTGIAALLLATGTADTPPQPPKVKQKIVIRSEPGGSALLYFDRFKALQASGDDVEIRGPCVSACTFIMILIPRERLCFDKTAWLGFHQAREENGVVSEKSKRLTEMMFDSFPSDIRRWLQDKGGVKKMPEPDDLLEGGLWTMPASELWKMGYRKCEPEARELK